ncbi:MAG: ROK family protein [Oscillospiraceae bacterium]|nr:ROK family protein [Oscillospiraceae bacterium]
MVRNINYELIGTFLSERGKSTIPTIAGEIGLSLPTVTRAIDFGLQAGMVIAAEMAESLRGRKAQLYMLNADYANFLLIILDNNELHYEVRNLLGGIVETGSDAVIYENALAGIEDVFSYCLKKHPAVSRAAIAVTGVTFQGVVLDSWTLPSLNGFHLQQHLENRFGITVIVENNVKAVTMAARKYIKNYNEKVIVAFEFGHTGFGAGISINGEILHGRNGSVGEFGSLPLNMDGAPPVTLYARSLHMLISIMNPHAVILYHANDEKTADFIISYIEDEMPSYAFPKFVKTTHFLEDCTIGLNTLCVRSLNEVFMERGAV